MDMVTRRDALKLAAASVVIGSTQVASVSAANHKEGDPFLGTWKLVPDKSRYNPGPAPKSLTTKYEPSEGAYKMSADGMDGTGREISMQYEAKFDGKECKITGSRTSDSGRFFRINANHTMAIFSKEGQEVSLISRSVSPDGKMLTVTIAGLDAAGKPSFNVAVFER
jgi:hypothetical protein